MPYDEAWPAGHRGVAGRAEGGPRVLNWLYWIIIGGIVGGIASLLVPGGPRAG